MKKLKANSEVSGVFLDGTRVRQLRAEKGKSIAELSKILSISESTINHIELNHQVSVSATYLKLIADYFGVTTDSLYKKVEN